MSQVTSSESAKFEEAARLLAAATGGSVLTDAAYGPQIDFEHGGGHFASGVTPLLEYGLLKVHGADAAAFLQAQLTNDVASLADGDVRLAGYCSVKGRLMATFWIWRDAQAQTFWLACSRDIAATVARRLSMFVLRAKAKVEDFSDRIALIGILRCEGQVPGSPAPSPAASAELPLPLVVVPATLAAASGPADSGPIRSGAVTGLQVSRALLPVPAEALAESLQRLEADGARLLSTTAWRRLEVLSGVPRINASSQERFVPQMVNFELVGGVSFRKGCYPGQEIVARSQYLGKLKRRMFLGLGSGAVPAPGTDVIVQGSAEPVGQVVLAAPLDGGERFAGEDFAGEGLADEGLAGGGFAGGGFAGRGFVVLFESQIAAAWPAGAAPDSVLRIGDAPVTPLALPYAFPVTPVTPAAAPAAGHATAVPDAAG